MEFKPGEVVEVRASVRVPAAATDKQVEEWLRFQFGFTGGIENANPLVDYDVESLDVRLG
jgi:zinc transporter ZupT